ncbi:unnamed protein product [Lepidochelys kempii]
MSPQAKTAIEREIQDMLQMGVIRPSGSAWASPVVLVPKPDGEICFCVDYRKLNVVTRPDNYPMPCTDELLEKLGSAQFISTLDLTKGYWQVPLDESAKEMWLMRSPVKVSQIQLVKIVLEMWKILLILSLYVLGSIFRGACVLFTLFFLELQEEIPASVSP